jgi:hypothetical protein
MHRVSRLMGVSVMAMAMAGVCAVQVGAQGDQGGQTPASLATVPVQVDVVLTRWQGEKRTSSTPFVLMANASPRGGSTSIRMGVDVPVGTSSSNTTQTSGAQTQNPRAVATERHVTEFRNVGTDVDVNVSRVDPSTFSVGVNIRDSSIFTSDQTKMPSMADPAAFRTFSTSNTLHMSDGQTRLFGVATDKITGETLRIEVKLTVLK